MIATYHFPTFEVGFRNPPHAGAWEEGYADSVESGKVVSEGDKALEFLGLSRDRQPSRTGARIESSTTARRRCELYPLLARASARARLSCRRHCFGPSVQRRRRGASRGVRSLRTVGPQSRAVLGGSRSMCRTSQWTRNQIGDPEAAESLDGRSAPGRCPRYCPRFGAVVDWARLSSDPRAEAVDGPSAAIQDACPPVARTGVSFHPEAPAGGRVVSSGDKVMSDARTDLLARLSKAVIGYQDRHQGVDPPTCGGTPDDPGCACPSCLFGTRTASDCSATGTPLPCTGCKDCRRPGQRRRSR